MIKIAICDDEPYILDELRRQTAKYMKSERLTADISCFESGDALLQSGGDFDIILLDIQMKGTGGMSAARELRKRSFKGYLIFVTAMEEYVFDSFEVSAFDYLVKPVSDEKFRKTFSRLLSAVNEKASENLMVQFGGESRIIPQSDIIFCEVIDKKIYIHTNSGETVTCYGKMETLENKLSKDFFKCHRSYLINLRHVLRFGKNGVKTRTGENIPLSRLRLKSLEEAAANFISDKGGKL